ncbi:hypothetical protein [Nesterenkonia sp. NBAIMH1]|uniref:hypothetical protein n=1 Tax=Nesterenkonia sp. NBAIMH1 TaxID=2600320 RepID=UPI0011B60B66|nr:hypothetical protein [Nesterenkonia sp. NBAIMH1]
MHADHEYLAAGFVLGGLTPEEDAAAQSLYEADTDFQLEVAAFSETMAALAESDEPVQPSADLDTAILGIPSRTAVDRPARTDSASEAEVSPRPARSGRPRITGLFALAAATLALVAAALGVLLVNQINQMQQVEESLTAEEQRREQMELLLGAPRSLG